MTPQMRRFVVFLAILLTVPLGAILAYLSVRGGSTLTTGFLAGIGSAYGAIVFCVGIAVGRISVREERGEDLVQSSG